MNLALVEAGKKYKNCCGKNTQYLENVSKNLLEIDSKKLYTLDYNGTVSVNNQNIKVVTEGK